MIFATSFGFFDKKLAAKYPDVKFEQATGTDTAPNLAEYFGAGEDTIYLSGMAAGAATKSGKLGYVVAVPDPRGDPARERVRARRAGDASGRDRQARLDELVVRPGEGEEGRREPRSAGADVLGQNVDSPATGQYAESKGVPWVGYDSDAQRFAPKSWLTASVYNWGPYYLESRQGRDGRHVEVRLLLRSIKDGFTELAPFGPDVTAATKAEIAKKMKEIENGNLLRVHRSALRPERQAARSEGPEDQVLKGGTNSLYGMNWLVKGVIGSPKGK